MSVRNVYEIAERKQKCRVCGENTKKLSRGRCKNCDYKNLEPIE